MTRDNSWRRLKAELQRLDAQELIGLIKALCDRDRESRSFVEARLAIGDDVLEPFRRRIQDALYPDPIHGPPISITAAKRAVSDYRRATDDLRGLLDLRLYYVECGTEMTLDYGDMDEAFYSSMESMFDRVIAQLQGGDSDMVSTFLPRAVRLVERADGLGWGYYDYLADRLFSAFPDEAS